MNYAIKSGDDFIAVFRYKADRDEFLKYLKDTWNDKRCRFSGVFVKNGFKLNSK